MNALKHLRDIEEFCREVISGESEYAEYSTAEVLGRVLHLAERGDLMCAGGCGLAYKDFGYDVLLADDLWNQISPRGDGSGVLCAICMVKRLAALDIRGITALRLLPIEREGEG